MNRISSLRVPTALKFQKFCRRNLDLGNSHRSGRVRSYGPDWGDCGVIGGTVVFGPNTSTLKQTMTDIKAAEAHRTELISRMARISGKRGKKPEKCPYC